MEQVIPWIGVAISVVFFAFLFMRIASLARILRDPEGLSRMLSEQVRDALEARGMDPDALDLEKLQSDPEVAELVGADIRKAMSGGVLRSGFALRDASGPGPREQSGRASGPTVSGRHADGSFRPEPIDRGGHGRWLAMAMLLVAALGACLYVAS